MSIDKLKNRFVTGAWLTDVKHYFSKINEIIDWVNNAKLPSYKVYTALLSQPGDNSHPTANVLENTLGNIVWTRDSVGEYYGTLTGAFGDGSKVFLNPVLDYSGAVSDKLVVGRYDTSDTIFVTYSIADIYTDGLYNIPIEIRVYN